MNIASVAPPAGSAIRVSKPRCKLPPTLTLFWSGASSYARIIATRTIRTLHLPADQVEDLAQELLLDYWRRLPEFDDGRGVPAAFANTVMNNHAATLIAALVAKKRDYRLCESLSKALEWSEQAADIERRLADLGCTIPSAAAQVLHGIDVERALAVLSPELRALARMLMETSVTDAAHALRLSRSTAYRWMGSIRLKLIENGLAKANSVSNTATDGREHE